MHFIAQCVSVPLVATIRARIAVVMVTDILPVCGIYWSRTGYWIVTPVSAQKQTGLSL